MRLPSAETAELGCLCNDTRTTRHWTPPAAIKLQGLAALLRKFPFLFLSSYKITTQYFHILGTLFRYEVLLRDVPRTVEVFEQNGDQITSERSWVRRVPRLSGMGWVAMIERTYISSGESFCRCAMSSVLACGPGNAGRSD